MDTTHLRNFLVIAQTGSLTRAATRANLTQPALSGQVRRLEEQVGAPLVQRHGRGLRLTPAGEILRDHAMQALAALDAAREAVGSLGSLTSGTLAIGGGATATAYLLPGILQRFHADHPGVRFSIREAPSRTIAEAVVAGELDAGVVTLPVPEARLTITPWLVDELVLLVPPQHPLRRKRAFQWKDLHQQPLIAFEPRSAVRELLDRALTEHDVVPAVVMEVRSIATITAMVEAGIGLGFVSRFADAAQTGLRPADRPLTRQLAVIEPRDRMPSAALQAFLRLAASARS
jgi:DNA-binding transcriptional LysR family regulator